MGGSRSQIEESAGRIEESAGRIVRWYAVGSSAVPAHTPIWIAGSFILIAVFIIFIYVYNINNYVYKLCV